MRGTVRVPAPALQGMAARQLGASSEASTQGLVQASAGPWIWVYADVVASTPVHLA